MTLNEFKNKIELLKEGVNTKKQELFAHLSNESSVEGDEAIAVFDAKTAELTNEVKALEDAAVKEYEKYKSVNPINWNLSEQEESSTKSVNVAGLEEMLNGLNVKTRSGDIKRTPGTVIGDFLKKNSLSSNDQLIRFHAPIEFKFELDSTDAVAGSEVAALESVKTLYTNNGTQFISGGNPVPGFQGYGCTIFEVADECQVCIEPRNFADLLTVRNMPTGNTIQYDYPVSRDDNAAGVLESIYNPYPTVVQNGLKPESTFTYNTAKVSVTKIAHWIGASDEVLEDCGKVAQRIDYHLTTGLIVERDRQLIAGSGTNGEALGLLLQPGLLSLDGTVLTAGIDTPNIWDKLYLAKLELEQNCANVDGVIINPADRAKVALAKDANGNYLFQQGTTCDVDMVGCLTIKISPDVPVGTAIIGEFRNNWVWYARKNLTVSMGMKNDDFTRNQKTFLAELRGAVVIFCPNKLAIVTNI